jgi:hypothetical protein
MFGIIISNFVFWLKYKMAIPVLRGAPQKWNPSLRKRMLPRQGVVHSCACEQNAILPQATTKIVIFLENLCNLNKFLQKQGRLSFFLVEILPNLCKFGEF